MYLPLIEYQNESNNTYFSGIEMVFTFRFRSASILQKHSIIIIK